MRVFACARASLLEPIVVIETISSSGAKASFLWVAIPQSPKEIGEHLPAAPRDPPERTRRLCHALKPRNQAAWPLATGWSSESSTLGRRLPRSYRAIDERSESCRGDGRAYRLAQHDAL